MLIRGKNTGLDTVETESIRQSLLGRIRRRRRPALGLRMAPMIDVIFLLLTFFVLTAKFRRPEQFLSMILPRAHGQVRDISVIEPVVIRISSLASGCAIQIGPETVGANVSIASVSVEPDLAMFANTFADVLSLQKRTAADPVEIICDDDVKWDYLVKIYDVISAMGVSDITFDMSQ